MAFCEIKVVVESSIGSARELDLLRRFRARGRAVALLRVLRQRWRFSPRRHRGRIRRLLDGGRVAGGRGERGRGGPHARQLLLEIPDISFEVCAAGKGQATLQTRGNKTQGRAPRLSKTRLAKASCSGVILPESLT